MINHIVRHLLIILNIVNNVNFIGILGIIDIAITNMFLLGTKVPNIRLRVINL